MAVIPPAATLPPLLDDSNDDVKDDMMEGGEGRTTSVNGPPELCATITNPAAIISTMEIPGDGRVLGKVGQGYDRVRAWYDRVWGMVGQGKV